MLKITQYLCSEILIEERAAGFDSMNKENSGFFSMVNSNSDLDMPPSKPSKTPQLVGGKNCCCNLFGIFKNLYFFFPLQTTRNFLPTLGIKILVPLAPRPIL